MRIYQALFGRFCKPLDGDGGEGSGGGGGDRGDNWTPTETPAEDLKKDLEEEDDKPEDDKDDDKPEDDKPEDDKDDDKPEDDTAARHKDGKFAKKGEGTMIPKSRFDDAVRKEREARETAERRLAEFEAQQRKVQQTADISEMEKKLGELRSKANKAIVLGNEDEAATLTAEADRLNRQIAIAQSSTMTAAAKAEAVEDMRFDITVENIQAQYPELDENSEQFDQDLVDDVLDKQRGFMERERLSPSKAMAKAAKYVMDRQQRAAPAVEEERPGLKAGERGTDRKRAAVEKNLDAAKRQPPSTRQLGIDSDKAGQTKETPKAEDMTYEEFAALPEATKAKMRGDLV